MQLPKSPFFGSFIKIPFFQSLGISSSFQILVKRVRNISTDDVISALIASGGIWSGPAALFGFICLIAYSISFFVGGLVLIGRSSLAGRISGGLSGGGRFSNCSKCSRQRLSCPSCSYTSFPCLSFTGLVIDVLFTRDNSCCIVHNLHLPTACCLLCSFRKSF